MKISHFQLENIRCFEDTGLLELGPVTVFVGRNNSGKTSLLRSLHHLQEGADPESLLRNTVEANRSKITAFVDGIDIESGVLPERGSIAWRFRSDYSTWNRKPSTGSERMIVPLFANRTNVEYRGVLQGDQVRASHINFSQLASKVVEITSDPESQLYKNYKKLCNSFLGEGALVTAYPVESSQFELGFQNEGRKIPLKNTGSGVPQIIGSIVELLLGENLVFLIDQIEQDLHPAAVDQLLDVIEERVPSIQVIATTHSNQVLRRLGAIKDSKVYEVLQTSFAPVPTSVIKEVPPTPNERLRVLHNLGYVTPDISGQTGWLIFEESSAERIVRQFIIPWFVPELGGLRTVASDGVSDIERRYLAFRALYTYAHLDLDFKENCFVIADGDDAGKEAIEQLQKTFPASSARFTTWEQEVFENYYPSRFAGRVQEIADCKDRKAKKRLKETLVKDVAEWLVGNPEEGRIELAKSAEEVIKHLKGI